MDAEPTTPVKPPKKRRLLRFLFWLVVGPAILLVSVLFHLDTPLARNVARDMVNDYASGEMAGELEIGRVEHLHWDEIIATNVVVRDPQGREVIRGEKVTLVPDLATALEGALRFSSAHLETGELILYEGEDSLPTFLESFSAADPTPSTGDPFHAIIDDITIENVTATGELLGIQGLRVEDVHATGRIDIAEFVYVEVRDVSGRVVAPYPFVATLVDVDATIDTDPASGIDMTFSTHIDEDERIDGTLGYRIPEGGELTDPAELDIRLRVDNVRARRLREVEFEWADAFEGRVDGTVRFHGPPEDLAIEADLDSDGGHLLVEGRIPSEGATEVELSTSELRLAEVYEGAPDITIEGRFQIRDDEDGTHVTGQTEAFDYDGTRVPPARIAGRLEEDAFEAERVELQLATGEVVARGRVFYDGSADLEVEADLGQVANEPLVQDIFEGLAGNARFNGELDLEPGSEVLDLDGRWVLTNVRYGPAKVDRLVATGRVYGPITGPSVNLALDATGVSAFDAPMGGGGGRIAGGPARYQTSIELTRPGQRIAIRNASIQDRGATTMVDIPDLDAEVGGTAWTGSVAGLALADGGLSVDRLSLRSGDQHLEAEANWRFARGPDSDRLLIEAQNVDLGILQTLDPDAPELAGLFAGRMEVGGDFEGQPLLTLDGQVQRMGYGSARNLDGRIHATYQRGTLTGNARLGSAQRGHVELTLQGTFDPELPLADTYRDGAYELTTAFENVDMTVLQAFDLGLPTLEGRGDGTLTASGTLDVFDFSAALRSDALRIDGMRPLGTKLRVQYRDGALIAHAATRDQHGELAEFETALLLDLTTAMAQPELVSEMLALAPWRVAVRLAPRDLGTLPPRVLEMLPDVSRWRGSASLTIRGGAYQPHADLIADLEWVGDIGRTLCGQEASPRFTIRSDMSEGRARVELHGLIRDRRFLFAEATADAPLAQWLASPDSFELPSTDVEAFVERVPLEDVPYACEVAGGPVTVSVSAQDIFTDTPRVELELSSDDVILRQLAVTGRGTQQRVGVTATTEPFTLRLHSLLSQGLLGTDIEASFRGGGNALVRADVPVVAGQQIPAIDPDGELRADLDLMATPLATLLFWLPDVGEVEGFVDGFAQADGPLSAPDIAGQLEVYRGHVELKSFGQRLDDIQGILLLEGDRITLQGVSARDGDGTLRIAGSSRLEGLFPSSVRLRLRANEFPVREEGSVMAALTGDAQLTGDLSSDGFEGRLDAGSILVELPDDPGRDPISLDAHPEIQVAGTERGEPADDAYVMHLVVDASNGFQMRGPDFSARLEAELDVVYADPELRVDGGVQLTEGHFEVFGKRFAVERGWLAFDGGTTLDPQVNLVAVHPLRGRPGETVTVTAGGRLSNPSITFSSTVTNDRAAIIALLVSGGDRRQDTERDATRQASDFLAGVAAGVLTLSLREEFGSYFPTIAIESNQLGGTRFRTGLSFEDLLPSAVRDVIQGVYFEGFLNTPGQLGTTAQGQNQEVGVRLELDFPRGIGNSYTIDTNTNWSADVTWQP